MADKPYCSPEMPSQFRSGAHRAMDIPAQGDTHYHISNTDPRVQCADLTHAMFAHLGAPPPFISPIPCFRLAVRRARFLTPVIFKGLVHIRRCQDISAGRTTTNSRQPSRGHRNLREGQALLRAGQHRRLLLSRRRHVLNAHDRDEGIGETRAHLLRGLSFTS